MSGANLPNELLCPISQEPMVDPVMASDGHTYERRSIEQWFSTNPAASTVKSPMTGAALPNKNLIPNIAIRKLIQDLRGNNNGPPPGAADGAREDPGAAHAKMDSKLPVDVTVHVSVEATEVDMLLPPNLPARPIHLVAVLDVSFSMYESCMTNTAAEGACFSRLDLVKHSMNTAIEMLREDDYLTLITFSNGVERVMCAQKMTPVGRSIARAKVNELRPLSSTNLWGGLLNGLEEITKPIGQMSIDQRFVDCGGHGAILLLTDGLPTNDYVPPRGIVPSLQSKMSVLKGVYPYTIHVCGYGYGADLDSALLGRIAELGGGTFAYIPDGSMVGTVFIHLVANLMSVTATGVRVRIGAQHAGEERTVGFLRSGQRKTAFFRPSSRDAAVVELTAAGVSEVLATVRVNEYGADRTLRPHQVFVVGLSRLLRDLGEAYDASVAARIVAETKADLLRLGSGRDVALYLNDWTCPQDKNKGQVERAVCTREDWERWGRHYLRSIYSAHANQEKMNFKDESMTLYASPQLEALYARGEEVFSRIEAPRPSRTQYSSSATSRGRATSMRTMIAASAGCFTSLAEVTMADGSRVKIANLRRGMKVKGGSEVDTLVVFRSDERVLSELCFPCGDAGRKGYGVTPYHPFLHPDTKTWSFPRDCPRLFYTKHVEIVPTLYNLVLRGGPPVVEIDGIEYVTLGHGLSDNSVVAHPYFGTDLVLRDVRQRDPAESGVAIFRKPVFKRDPATGLVTGVVEAG